MENEFLTDTQQAERAKQWLRENGMFVVAGVVLGLGGLFGWQQWREYKVTQAGEAAIVWEQMRTAIDGERYNEVDEYFELLSRDYASTPYLDQARLVLARMYMSQNSPDAAKEQLVILAREGRDMLLRRVAEFRTVQILLYQSEYDEALRVLGDSRYPAFAGFYHDLRGDILFAQQRLEDAAAEYQLALDKDADGSIDRAYVQIKLDDVSGSIAVTAFEAADAVDESGADQPVTAD